MLKGFGILTAAILLTMQVFASSPQEMQLQDAQADAVKFDTRSIEGVTIIKPLNQNDIKFDIRYIQDFVAANGSMILMDQDTNRRLTFTAYTNTMHIVYYNSKGVKINSYFVDNRELRTELFETSRLIKDGCPLKVIIDIKTLTLKQFRATCPAEVAIGTVQENAG